MSHVTFPKPSRTARKMATKKKRGEIDQYERDEKAKVRKRDGYRCRFPLCGCHRLKLNLEVAHAVAHKGMGGDRRGDRSEAAAMLLLCSHRHQHSDVSLHAGTLRPAPVTADGLSGPVRWLIDIGPGTVGGWRVLAREVTIGVVGPLDPWQLDTLKRLARMEI